MDKFQEMLTFVTVVDSGSFVNAATTLNSSKAAMSRQVAELEQRLMVRLLNRTTRKLSLTEDGKLFYLRCKDLLHAVEEAESELNSRTGEASGQLNISVPVTFGITHLAPLWAEFLNRHPKVTLDISLSDRTIDLVEDGIDLAIRISRSPHPTYIARNLATTKMVVCATPAYLERHGEPAKPADLADHQVVAYTYWSSKDEWEFIAPDGTVDKVKTRARLHANSGDTCLAVALRDQGIIMQPDFLVYDALRSGALVSLLPHYQAVELGIYAVYASRRQLPLRLRFLIDFLLESFREPVWDLSRSGEAGGA